MDSLDWWLRLFDPLEPIVYFIGAVVFLGMLGCIALLLYRLPALVLAHTTLAELRQRLVIEQIELARAERQYHEAATEEIQLKIDNRDAGNHSSMIEED